MKSTVLILILIVFCNFGYAQFIQTNGPEGGIIHDIIYNGSVLAVATDNGVYMSNNNGNNWFYIGLNLSTKLAFRANEIYSTSSQGLMKTTNNGNNWNNILNQGIYTFHIFNNNLFASDGFYNVYYSSNFGINWVQVNNGLPSLPIIFSFCSINNDVYAVSYGNGIYKTSNYGMNWYQITSQNTLPFTTSITSQNNHLFANSSNAVFKSTNDGQNWINISGGLNILSPQLKYLDNKIYICSWGQSYYSTNEGGNWISLNIDGYPSNAVESITNNNIYVATEIGVLNSINAGGTWQFLNNDIKATSIRTLKSPDYYRQYAGASAGMFFTNNSGDNWISRSSGLMTKSYIFAIHFFNEKIFCSTPFGIYVSSDNGITWQQRSNGLTGQNIFSITDLNDILFSTTTTAGVFKSTNEGLNWILCKSGSAFDIAKKGSTLFAATGDGVYISNDLGNNWILQNSGFGSNNAWKLAVKDNFVFAITNGSGVYRTSNNGITWAQCNNGIGNLNLHSISAGKNCIVVGNLEHANPNHGVYFSTNNGNNWTNIISGGLENINILSLSFGTGYIYVGTLANSVWKRSLSGLIQTPIAISLVSPLNNSTNQVLTPLLDWDSIPNALCYNIHVSSNANFTNLIIDTNGILNSNFIIGEGKLTNGQTYYWKARAGNEGGYGSWSPVWNFSTTTTGITILTQFIPDKFKISQNYPNPFNSSTKIQFAIPNSSDVSLVVYDITGKEIDKIINTKVNPGTYETNWDASIFPSGVYFYKIQAGNFVQTKKMVILK